MMMTEADMARLLRLRAEEADVPSGDAVLLERAAICLEGLSRSRAPRPGSIRAKRALSGQSRLIEIYDGGGACPDPGCSLTWSECRDIAQGPMPTSSTERLRQWTACRSCPQHAATAATDISCLMRRT